LVLWVETAAAVQIPGSPAKGMALVKMIIAVVPPLRRVGRRIGPDK
jgi:hypothetical protein